MVCLGLGCHAIEGGIGNTCCGWKWDEQIQRQREAAPSAGFAVVRVFCRKRVFPRKGPSSKVADEKTD